MDILGALGVLVRVVETGSFSAAARERELSQAAVARQFSQLEDHFGVRLFHRTTRKLSLTDDGEKLLDMARPVLDGVEGMEAALGRQSAMPIGLVRVGATVAASRFLAQSLPTLLAAYPGLKVELVVGDRLGDMIEERLDLAMRVGEITDASLVARRTGATVRVAVAAPSYIERHGEPTGPADLANHTCIVHDVGPGSDAWSFVTPEGLRDVRVSGGFLANDVRAVHLAARTGYGIAYLALVEVFDDLRSGTLVQCFARFPRTRRSVQPGLSIATAPCATHARCPRLHLEQVRQLQAELATAADESAPRKRRANARSLTQPHSSLSETL
jgi:DNA-binding transcriptional LysR family regulator